ncbi:zinc ribbon domain-containing protein [Ferrimicrobium acidiphilum]|uniref:zinc ribbon domain-containing protein n=1 Tax=Ferrimicrobium acidiphilum TaxID=121039 RepID=UPI0023F4EE49|nr:zinc ribbon domain-containing protein [Ferrimicrobium acidiphilum]
MKRTVRLATLSLNKGKYDELYSVIKRYTDAKRVFVAHLRQTSLWRLLDRSKSFRDYAKARGLYPEGINVHLIDQAAFDAVDTCIRHIESCFARADIKAKTWRRFTDENERHYAYACLARYSAIGQIMGGGVPEISTVTTSLDARVKIAAYLHRVIRDALGSSWPTVVKARSMSLDSGLYSVADGDTPKGKTRRYVQVVSSTHHKRISLPLSGISRVSGNIRVVLDEEHQRAFIHVIYDVARLPRATGPAIALDWGITEVCTDSSGVHHGKEYGPALRSMTERRNKTDKARNRLHALSKKDAGSKRTKHIARNNLGTKKQQARLRRTKAQLQTISGATIKEVVYGEGNRTRAKKRVPQLPSQRPREIIIEDLSHLQGKAKSKNISRLCSSWARAENQERITVHAYVGGSGMKTVNAAYSSQTCPDPGCGYVHRDNRHGDVFHCRNPDWECNWQGDVDHVAAMNIASRIEDRQINRFTPYRE